MRACKRCGVIAKIVSFLCGFTYECPNCDYDIDVPEAPTEPCDVPPDGWRCTRGKHEGGPCAAVPERCHGARDGDCNWKKCPQLRDDEPKATGRHCPLDTGLDLYEY